MSDKHDRIQNKDEHTEAVKHSTHQNLLAKVMCVIAAFCLWIYVMQVESPEYEEVFSHITVELVGTEELIESKGLTIYSGYGQVIDVTLSGKKSVISKLTEKDIVATADTSMIEEGGNRYTCRVTVDVPAGCKLVSMSQESISVYLDKVARKTVEITESRDNTKLPEGCYTGLIQFPVDMITVTGPAKELDKISKAVVAIDLTGVTETTTMTQPVKLVDKYGAVLETPYVDYYPREVTLSVPVIKSEQVPVEVDFLYDFLSEDNTEISITPAFIEVTGDPALINKGSLIAPIEIKEKLDFDDMTCKGVVYLEAAEGVTLSASYVDLEINIDSSIKTRQITVPGENIKDTGGKTGVQYSWSNTPVTVTIMGPIDAISKISPEDITIKLDMSPYNESNTGVIKVRAEIDIDSAYADQVIEVGTYDIAVTFNQ
ncbi:MAG: hypothetical protein IJ037_07460 [Clostridia bacterium]|nr:hypothetical protein [Clostridia bacterium]